MLDILSLIPNAQRQAFEKTISEIVARTKPVKIVCYGVRSCEKKAWSSFWKEEDLAIRTDYDLLVITDQKEKAKRDAISQIILNHSNPATNLKSIVHSIDAVNDALKEENFFFTSIYHNGRLIYQRENPPFMVSAVRLRPIPLSVIKSHWNKWFGLAHKFYEGSSSALTKGAQDLAMFMLHQSVEHSCIALIRIYTGYRTSTHKLGKLLDMVDNFSSFAITPFPRRTSDEVKLLAVLEHAYVEARYKDDYAVSENVVKILSYRIEDFMRNAELLYADKLKALDRIESGSIIRYELSCFDSIGIDTVAKIVLQRGDKEELEIHSPDGCHQCVGFRIDRRRLWMFTDLVLNDQCDVPTVIVTYKNLNGLVVNYSPLVTSREAIEVERLGIFQNGRGKIDIAVEALLLDVTILKSGHLQVKGSVEELRVYNRRNGEFDGRDLQASSCTVILRGSGKVLAQVEDELTADLRGGGNLLLKGMPRLKSILITGTGRLKHFDLYETTKD